MQGTNVVGVQFRRAGKIYDFSSEGVEVSVGDFVVVNSDRGPSLAEVVAIRFLHPKEKTEKKLKPIMRRASQRELSRPTRLTPEFVEDYTHEQVRKHDLNMKVLRSEVQFGGSKVIVYFTAPGRVDFRELVKDLAGGLKTRIELKQIGARDETKLLGGLGICGREYCCSSFLREFVPVSIRMAKNQNLALNPSKVSGGCGRLLCCLTYENKTYSSLRTSLPSRGTKVRVMSLDQTGTVIKSDLLNQIVGIEGRSGDVFEAKVSDLEILDRSSTPDSGQKDELSDQDQDALEWAEGLDLDELSGDISTLESEEPEKKLQPKKGSRRDSKGSDQNRRSSFQKSRSGQDGKRPFSSGQKSQQPKQEKEDGQRGRSSRPKRGAQPQRDKTQSEQVPRRERSSSDQGQRNQSRSRPDRRERGKSPNQQRRNSEQRPSEGGGPGQMKEGQDEQGGQRSRGRRRFRKPRPPKDS